MPRLEIDFSEVPTEIALIPPGIYELEITEIPTLEPTKDQTSHNLIVKMKLINQDDPKLENRSIWDFISVKMESKLKRLCLSAGLKVGKEGVDLEDLFGKTLKAEIYTNVWNEQKRSKIKQYQI